jgi:hypothetical protein
LSATNASLASIWNLSFHAAQFGCPASFRFAHQEFSSTATI